MKSCTPIIATLALIFSLPIAAADSAYVIDKLLVGVHQDQDLNSAIIKVLPTGTKLEVVKRDGELALIKDSEGASGWVDAAYLMEEVPASVRVQTLADENAALTAKLNAPADSTSDANAPTSAERDKLTNENTELKGKLSAEKLKSGQLQTTLSKLEKQAAERAANPADKLITDLEAANQTLTRDLEGVIQTNKKLESQQKRRPLIPDAALVIEAFSMPILIGFGIALVLAFGAGAYLIDYLGRKRHGGYRV